MSSKLTYSAVIFDMDGLMFDTERLGIEGYHHAARQHGYEPESDAFHSIIGRNVIDAKRHMREKFGPDFPIEKIRESRHHYVHEVYDKSGVPIKEGLMELLKYLKERRVPLAVASSSSRSSVEKNLKRAGVFEDFKVVVCGDEVTRSKPDPEIFLTAAEKMEIAPSECVVLEDSLFGLEAAHAAGMMPIMVPDMQMPNDAAARMARAILPSLHEVRTYLESESA